MQGSKNESELYYGFCKTSLLPGCNNSYCCHGDRRLRAMHRALQWRTNEEFGAYFDLSRADYKTDRCLLRCKYCGAENSLFLDSVGGLLFKCSNCNDATRPWNFPYSSKKAECDDMERKAAALEDGVALCEKLEKAETDRDKKRALTIGKKGGKALLAEIYFCLEAKRMEENTLDANELQEQHSEENSNAGQKRKRDE